MVDGLKESHATHSEPKLNRRLTVLSKSTRVISPGSLSGETLNENDESGLENVKTLSQSKEELQPAKYRLQRQKGQNRRSLRVRTTPNRVKDPIRAGIGLFKSETIDNSDDLKQQQHQQHQQQQQQPHQPQPTTVHSPMIRSCTAENDSTTSSPSYISGGPSLLASPQDRDNDSNGNLHSSTIAAIYHHECSTEKTALLHMNSIDSCGNSSSNNQPSTMAGNTNNNNNNNNNNSNNNSSHSTTSNKLNNNNEFPMRVISNLSLTLNTRSSANETTSNNVALSPFETTLTTLPFADEDV